MPTLDQEFVAAQAAAKQLKNKPDNESLLELYSYFKQATDGDVSGDKPGPFDFVARAKYDAWEGRKGLSKEASMKGYVKLVKHLQSVD